MGTFEHIERGISRIGSQSYSDDPSFDRMIRCPICEDDHAHIDGVTHKKRERSEEIYIEFWGECHHRWGITLSHSKGNTFIYLDIPDKDRHNPYGPEVE